MSGSDVAMQFQLKQHANSLEKKLRKARRQLKQTERKWESASVAVQAFSEQLDTDRQLKSINELWQQLQDAQAAYAAAEQKQAEQQMQDVHAQSMLVEMRTQLKADKAERASAVSKLEEALQSQDDAAQQVRNSNIVLKTEVEELKQKIVAETRQRSDLQRDLHQQSICAADMDEHLVAAQHQLAAVTAEKVELQLQNQAWASQCEDMRTAAKAKDDKICTLKNKNLAVVDAVRKAHTERENQAEQAAGLLVQLERFQAEMTELRRSSAAQISHLQAEHLNCKKIGAVHSVANPKRGAQKSVQSTQADLGAKMQSGMVAAVGSETTRRAAAAAASKAHMTSKGVKLTTIGKVVGSAQHVHASGKSAINKMSIGRGGVTGGKAAAHGRVGKAQRTAQRKQPSTATQKKILTSRAQAGAAITVGLTSATAGAAVNSGALPMDASLPIADVPGCQTKVDTSTTEPVQTDRHVREQAELVQTSEASLSQNFTGAGSKRKRAISAFNDSCQKRRL